MDNAQLQVQSQPAGAMQAVPVSEVLNQVKMIQDVMATAMRDNEHYGKIPGCGPKPTLLKAGAEKLSLMFRLAPHFSDNGGSIITKQMPNNHMQYDVVCSIVHIPTGQVWATGVGSCSTMESKYRFRKAEQKCPKCGKETIIKGKQEYSSGWLCFAKKGGCGAKFKDGDKEIENQNMGRVEHDNPADYWNTCLKMAKKRAYVDGILSATAASDIFTQDIEDIKENLASAVEAEVVELPPEEQDHLDSIGHDAGRAASPNDSFITGEQIAAIKAEINMRMVDVPAFLKWIKAETIEEIEKRDFSKCLEFLAKKSKKAQ